MEADDIEHLGHHGAVHKGVQRVDMQRGNVVHLRQVQRDSVKRLDKADF